MFLLTSVWDENHKAPKMTLRGFSVGVVVLVQGQVLNYFFLFCEAAGEH